ncbi:SDR family oxidoreductase [Rhizobium sp. P38BS-XIX]|uniref:SDR family NAD(P)-dependent oxidoreductase n=1 Tax=Rhizobium sp. P38BS-XIX TaxID=2726740 RepID=UPI001456A7F3|nr:SDR family oxidoreductase [Rhizobium sp. P38BS-XIX]NLS00771.1 SDR family oxidoreductase [Rhizobium sp. P38BS-XIX]
MDLKLTGKTALVTGSTAGIGLAIAKRLIEEGATVIMPGRSQTKLDEATKELEGIAKGKVRPIVADVATAEGAKALVDAVPDVDILINNLGIYESKPFEDITDDDWRRFFEINVLSGARLARSYFPGMLKRDWGRVIFIASESGVLVPTDMIHYGMTKTAQLSISRGLAGLTKGTNVTVNTVMPGTTRSEGIEDFLKSVAADPTAPMKDIEAQFFAKDRSSSLIQRMIEADEIATLVAYVASPLSAATNGAALRVDGGITPTIV